MDTRKITEDGKSRWRFGIYSEKFFIDVLNIRLSVYVKMTQKKRRRRRNKQRLNILLMQLRITHTHTQHIRK